MKTMPCRRQPSSRRAFTLVEMLLVIAIIGLIAALVTPQIAKQFQKSQLQTTKAQMALLEASIQDFYSDNGRYPTETEGLKVLIDKPQDLATWSGPYLKRKSLPKDGWGSEFVYKLDPAFGFVIRSFGADKREGGTPGSQDADIDNRS